ncbi:MAG: hypothetical protein K8R59_09095 [Thermoanaerobaculales bacterium]|nr:hypothetical protein [Thermoanaerobaculales bacterium]
MKHIISALTLTLLLGGCLTLAMAALSAESEKKPCCFTNTRYSGQCKVTPGADESCADVLTYLNSQTSVGKTYCGNTTIRGGWVSVTCEEKQATQ